jgi:hypothetical protein
MLKEIAKANDLNLPDEDHFDEVADVMDKQMMANLIGQNNGGDMNGQVSAGGSPPNSAALNQNGDHMGAPELQSKNKGM